MRVVHKAGAADAHSAGFRCGLSMGQGQLMLMMLAVGAVGQGQGQLMLMMLTSGSGCPRGKRS